MAREQSDEQKRYHGNLGETEDFRATTERQAKKVAPHQSENKVTRSTEGSVETTTTEHK